MAPNIRTMPSAAAEPVLTLAAPPEVVLPVPTPTAALAQPAMSAAVASQAASFMPPILPPLGAGAQKAIAHCSPLRRLRRRLDQDQLAARAVELAQRGI